MDTLIGTSVGGYRLTQSIGSGGMGTVYLAEDMTIGQQVAIKIIRADSADIPDASSAARALERFKQEARAIASLDHLHILPLYRYGEEQTNTGQRAYMVMQYRPEGSLWDWLRNRAGFFSGQTRPGAYLLPSTPANAWPLSLVEATEYLRRPRQPCNTRMIVALSTAISSRPISCCASMTGVPFTCCSPISA